MTKNKVIETLDQLPDEFNMEELVEKLIFIEEVEKGLKDAADGNTMDYELAKKQIREKWQTSK